VSTEREFYDPIPECKLLVDVAKRRQELPEGGHHPAAAREKGEHVGVECHPANAFGRDDHQREDGGHDASAAPVRPSYDGRDQGNHNCGLTSGAL